MTKEFLEGCLAEGLSLDQIGALAGKAPSTVSYHLKKHGLKPVGAKYASKGGLGRELLEPLFEAGLTIAEMSRELDVNPTTIRRWLQRHGLWPLPATLRRQEAREAKERGQRYAELECRQHGRTTFILEGRGYYRCLQCRSERVVEWRRQKKRLLVREHGGACRLCGYDRCLAALEFHHRDRKTKLFSISRQGVTRSFAELREEAKKCDLLCANCHAEVECGEAASPGDAEPSDGNLPRAA